MEKRSGTPPSPLVKSFQLGGGTPPPSPLARSPSTPTDSKASPTKIKDEGPPADTPQTPAGDVDPKAQCPSMVNQFFKLLLRKHSSGDLHSRLKTRKLLGVGETDDGDIHRSKLSQILGHSDQLYIKLPYGLRIWQLLLAIMFTVVGAWAVLLPSHLFKSALEVADGDHVTLPIRLYGGALLSLSLVFWATLRSQDRDIIRMCLLTSIVYFSIQVVVTLCHLIVYSRPDDQLKSLLMLLASRTFFILVSIFYHWALTQRKFSPGAAPPGSSMRRNTSSARDLGAAGVSSSAYGYGYDTPVLGGGGGVSFFSTWFNGGSSSSSGGGGGGGRDDAGGAVGGSDEGFHVGNLADRLKSKDV